MDKLLEELCGEIERHAPVKPVGITVNGLGQSKSASVKDITLGFRLDFPLDKEVSSWLIKIIKENTEATNNDHRQ